MESKITHYEIIDIYPKILEAKTPIISIIRSIVYFTCLISIKLWLLITGKHNLKNFLTKKETTEKEEDTPYLDTNHKTDKKIKRTVSKYLNKKESHKLLQHLLHRNIEIDFDKFTDNFRIKIRTEYFDSEENEDKEIIVYTFPKIAAKITKIIKDPNES